MGKKYNCYFEMAFDIVGGKWKPLILYFISINTVARHSELKKFIPSINERMLTRQLRELEKDSIIKRKVYPTFPLKVEYTLTEFGLSLIPILNSLLNWSKEYASKMEFHDFNMKLPR